MAIKAFQNQSTENVGLENTLRTAVVVMAWACPTCTLRNSPHAPRCDACSYPRPLSAHQPIGFDPDEPPAGPALERQLSNGAKALLLTLGQPRPGTRKAPAAPSALFGGESIDTALAAPPLRRQLTKGSAEVLEQAGNRGHNREIAADVLQRASDAEREKKISHAGKVDIQRVILVRGVTAASAHLDALLGTPTPKPPPVPEAPALSISAAMARTTLGDAREKTTRSPRSLTSPDGPGISMSAAMERSSGEAAPKPTKKKKKKNAYASMMQGIMAPQQTEAEKNLAEISKLKSGLGGGQFSKLDKI